MSGAAGYWLAVGAGLTACAFATGVVCGIIFKVIRGSRRARRRSE